MSFEVRLASDKDRDAWNRFVDSERGSFFQYYDWKFYYESGNSARRYIPLCIEDRNGQLAGIFPLVENTAGYYATLISLPEGSSNGFIVRGDLDPAGKREAIGKFLDYVDATFSKSHALVSLQEHMPPPYGTIEPSSILLEHGYEFEGDLATKLPGHFVLPLKKPFQDVFNGMQRKQRYKIRTAKKLGATVVIDEDFRYFDTFIAMQVELVKKFGLSMTIQDYMPLLSIFRDKMKLFMCFADNEPISGVLCYYTPTTAAAVIGAYRPSAEKYHNNLVPHCYAIRHACEKDLQYFDFGITLTPSLAFYKEKFGAQCIPIMAYKKIFSPAKVAANKAVLSFRLFAGH